MLPRTFVEEEDALPLTDLLRTGEASRLRRRGAMRGGHRREDSDDLAMPLHRRVRVESTEQRQDERVYLELSCGVRTGECSFAPANTSSSSPLPQIQSQSSRPLPDVGFVFASTGCGTPINSRALPRQPGCSGAYQVYTSTELTSPDVARLSPKYLDSEQRAIADFFAREDCDCQCDWEAIGCRACGNALGFLYRPCHSRHALDNSRAGAIPTYVFFPSSVTPSPSYIFPTIDPSLFRTLPPLVALSESDDMDSPTFSPRVQLTSSSDFYGQSPRTQPLAPAQDDNDAVAFSWFNDPNPGSAPSAPGSPTIPTPLAFSALTERPTDYPRADSEHPAFLPVRPPISSDGARPRGQGEFGPIARMGTQPMEVVATTPRASREVLSDDDWSIYLLSGDRAPATARRPIEARGHTVVGTPLHPWVPREQRERPPGALTPGERALDRLATITRPDNAEWTAAHSGGSAVSTRAPETPALHRVPRRALSAMMPPSSPSRRPASSDTSWRQFIGGPPRPSSMTLPSRSAHAPERQEQSHDNERASRTSRWATTAPGSGGRPSRRTDPGPAAPAFTLLDSAGERSYPPSARSNLDARDNLSVESEASVFRLFSRYLNEDALVEAVALDPDLTGARPTWTDMVSTEEPDAEDEEKPEDERRTGEPQDRRAPSETDVPDNPRARLPSR